MKANIMNRVLFALLVVVVSLNAGIAISQVIDADGKFYNTINIGNQVWMAENLSVSRYLNGDVIPQVQNKDEWSRLTTGAWCYYDNNPNNEKVYGKLYNWYAVNDPRGLAPKGWHVPTDEEWTELIEFLGGETIAGGKMKLNKMWEIPNVNATNQSGLSTIPAGIINNNGIFFYLGKYTSFWSSTEKSNIEAWSRGLDYRDADVDIGYDFKTNGLSVRCVKN
jgi:uncharacterized protein (TIGR02145 family)